MTNETQDAAATRQSIGEAAISLRALDELIVRNGAPTYQALVLATDEARVYYLSQEVEAFDREVRRVVAQARQGSLPLEETLLESVLGRPGEKRNSQSGSRPDHPSLSSLRLVSAEPGSSYLLMEAIGMAISVMASQPMTAIVNAMAWSGPVRRVSAWLNRSSDPLNGVSARQAVSVLSEFGGHPSQLFGSGPDQEIAMDGSTHVKLPDGTVVSGRRIHVVQSNPDGTTTWIQVE